MHILSLIGNSINHISVTQGAFTPVSNVLPTKDPFGMSRGVGIFEIPADGEYTLNARVACTIGSSGNTIGLYRDNDTNCLGKLNGGQVAPNGSFTFCGKKGQLLFVGFVTNSSEGGTIYADSLATVIDLFVESV